MVSEKEAIRKALKRARVNERIQTFLRIQDTKNGDTTLRAFTIVLILGEIEADSFKNDGFEVQYFEVNPLDEEMNTFNKVFTEFWNSCDICSLIKTYSPKTRKWRTYLSDSVIAANFPA